MTWGKRSGRCIIVRSEELRTNKRFFKIQTIVIVSEFQGSLCFCTQMTLYISEFVKVSRKLVQWDFYFNVKTYVNLI